ncbi:MAG: hypothetical protein CM1200mP22_25360 [Dehalococcoidia bacterium]|nr:MAG: hypothetical protein CM1200mP22_25360 [Dehalococcoidia bacterium]
MALEISKPHTALLVMDFENDIVHPDGAFKDFGFAQMVADNDVLGKTSQLLAAARGAGVTVIHVSVKFREGYPERAANSGLWQGLHGLNALVEGTWGAQIHDQLTPEKGEALVTKRGVSAFTASDIEQILHNKRIGTLLLAGVATNFVVKGKPCASIMRPWLRYYSRWRLLRFDEPGGARCLFKYSTSLSLHGK